MYSMGFLTGPFPIQINAYSLSEEKNAIRRDFARQLLKDKMVMFIGSDAHRINHRPLMSRAVLITSTKIATKSMLMRSASVMQSNTCLVQIDKFRGEHTREQKICCIFLGQRCYHKGCREAIRSDWSRSLRHRPWSSVHWCRFELDGQQSRSTIEILWL